MLPLDDRRWTELSHAYGFAGDIPKLLLALREFPSDSPAGSEPWHSLWSALFHQGDVYSASFAAVPHIIEALLRDPTRACASYFKLPACIELARVAHHYDVPAYLLEPYVVALSRVPDISATAANPVIRRGVLAAVAVSKGQWSAAQSLLEVDASDS